MDHHKTGQRSQNVFERTEVLGKLSTTVSYNDWTWEEACLTVVENGHKQSIGRDFFSSRGLAVVQQKAKVGKSLNNIDNFLHVKLNKQSHHNFSI